MEKWDSELALRAPRDARPEWCVSLERHDSHESPCSVERSSRFTGEAWNLFAFVPVIYQLAVRYFFFADVATGVTDIVPTGVRLMLDGNRFARQDAGTRKAMKVARIMPIEAAHIVNANDKV